MDTSPKNLGTLFQQLGLAHDDASIEKFIAAHRAPNEDAPLWEAPFWTPAQAGFLKEAWEADADWVEWVDELNTLLHQS